MANEWTFKTLKIYLNNQIKNLHHELEGREKLLRNDYDNKIVLLSQIMDERRDASADQFEKASEITAQKFAATNQYRTQITDLTASLMRRTEFETAHEALVDRVNSLDIRLSKAEGRGNGLQAGWIYLLGMVTLISTVVTIILAFKH